MPEGDSSGEGRLRTSRWWRQLKSLVGRDHEPTLRESLEEAIDEAEDAGPSGSLVDDLGPDERDMLRNMLHMGERRAGDIAVPRSDMVMFDIDEGFAALVARFAEARHSRMPLWRGSRDDIIGMVHVKDVYARIADTFNDAVSSAPLHDLPIEPLMRPVLFVPASMRLMGLLTKMRADRTHMAIIIDEHGGVDGLVTIEDLMEEIVGDIADEHDEEETALITATGPHSWDADARLPIDDLETTLGERLADAETLEEVDTLGGLVFMLAGRVPAPGETVVHPAGWTFTVTEGDPRMVKRLAIGRGPGLEA
ncbi:magnesium/cobalt efflux protein [Sandarakinorhabdus cyanobacteriorum]|uniref:Magnesium/cobalt efflux protein n=1 Tax=Sandarakinorhabdus cyanobacteriorum TaxID=1981098 RepID=A0A255YRP8_9SPHN|nr:hemolysin family protein [Sandarakinorhabdus cyanobacteriorum]OYQ31100.1 magnesium/cobalt efflux protein [Sandarakinorhabdus cyanobacteriorum]